MCFQDRWNQLSYIIFLFGNIFLYFFWYFDSFIVASDFLAYVGAKDKLKTIKNKNNIKNNIYNWLVFINKLLDLTKLKLLILNNKKSLILYIIFVVYVRMQISRFFRFVMWSQEFNRVLIALQKFDFWLELKVKQIYAYFNKR